MPQAHSTIGRKSRYFHAQFCALFAGNDGFAVSHCKGMVSGGYLLGMQVTCWFSAGYCCWRHFCCETILNTETAVLGRNNSSLPFLSRKTLLMFSSNCSFFPEDGIPGNNVGTMVCWGLPKRRKAPKFLPVEATVGRFFLCNNSSWLVLHHHLLFSVFTTFSLTSLSFSLH